MFAYFSSGIRARGIVLHLGEVFPYNKFLSLNSIPLRQQETTYRVFLHDVTAAMLVSKNNETAAMLVSQNNKTAAMLVSQTSLVGDELFSYANTFFCSNKFA